MRRVYVVVGFFLVLFFLTTIWFSGGFAAIGSSLIAALSIRSSFFYSHNRVTQCVCFSSPAQDDVVIGGIRAGEVTVGDVSRASLSLDGLMWGNVTLVVCGAPCCRLVPSVSGDVSLFVLRFFVFFFRLCQYLCLNHLLAVPFPRLSDPVSLLCYRSHLLCVVEWMARVRLNKNNIWACFGAFGNKFVIMRACKLLCCVCVCPAQWGRLLHPTLSPITPSTFCSGAMPH